MQQPYNNGQDNSQNANNPYYPPQQPYYPPQQPYYPPQQPYYPPPQPYYPPQHFNAPNPLREHEFQTLRSHSIAVGLCAIAYIVFQQIIIILLDVFGLREAYLNNPGFQYAFSAVFFTTVSLGLPFFFYSLKKGSRSYIGVLPFNAPKEKGKAFYLVFFGFLLCVAANFVATVVGNILNGVGLQEAQNPDMVSRNAFEIVLNYLSIAVFPPLIEEFVFRGVIMQPLRRYGDHFAVVSTALIFALAHGSVTTGVFAFIAGLAMGYSVVLSGSIWTGVFIHFLNNCFAVTVTELYNNYSGMNDKIYWLIIAVVAALGMGSLVALLIIKAFRFRKGEAETVLLGKRARAFFFSIPMVITILILLAFIAASFA